MRHWSKQLCDALMADLPEERLAACSDAPTDDKGRRQLMDTWRDAHAELCQLMSDFPLKCAPEKLIASCERFGEAAVLLEMITDPHDDGWELARWTVRHLPPSPVRAEMDRLLASWFPGQENSQESKRDLRIVIFGGHPRDESKFQDHHFDAANVTFVWNTFEKGRGTPDRRTIDQSMQTAEAVVVVTKLVSHNVMQMVKRSASAMDVPFCCIDKATASQLEHAIREIVEPPCPDVGSR